MKITIILSLILLLLICYIDTRELFGTSHQSGDKENNLIFQNSNTNVELTEMSTYFNNSIYGDHSYINEIKFYQSICFFFYQSLKKTNDIYKYDPIKIIGTGKNLDRIHTYLNNLNSYIKFRNDRHHLQFKFDSSTNMILIGIYIRDIETTVDDINTLDPTIHKFKYNISSFKERSFDMMGDEIPYMIKEYNKYVTTPPIPPAIKQPLNVCIPQIRNILIEHYRVHKKFPNYYIIEDRPKHIELRKKLSVYIYPKYLYVFISNILGDGRTRCVDNLNVTDSSIMRCINNIYLELRIILLIVELHKARVRELSPVGVVYDYPITSDNETDSVASTNETDSVESNNDTASTVSTNDTASTVSTNDTESTALKSSIFSGSESDNIIIFIAFCAVIFFLKVYNIF